MPSGFNRALQVRAANRLRAQLPRQTASGLPLLGGLTQSDQRELCEVGGGRLAAVALRLAPDAVLSEVVGRIGSEVRRTDLLGVVNERLMLLLVPGLDPVGGESLVERLAALLGTLQVEIGVAYRSNASSSGWTAEGLAAEAVAQSDAQEAPPRADLASA